MEEGRLKFITANCRSLKEKIESLAEHLNEVDASFAILSETWITSENIDRVKNDLEKGFGLKIIEKHRRGKKKGGGVAIVWRDSKINFSRYKLFTGDFEIVAAKTKLRAAERSMFVFSTYYPPNMSVNDVIKMNEIITDEIQKIKTKEENPVIVVSGDMNGKDCSVLCSDFPDVFKVDTPPTRGGNCLDLCYTNFVDVTSSLIPPLSSRFGTVSDHDALLMNVIVPRKVHIYSKFTRRKVTKEGEESFCQKVNNHDWSELYRMTSPSEKTDYFHSIIEDFKNSCFPLVTSKVRDDEDPWITDYLRKLVNRKIKEFGRHGKSILWFELRDLTEKRIGDAKNAYYEREVEKMTNGKNTNLAYSALRNLKSAERPKPWSLQDIAPDEDLGDILEYTADFFSEISNKNTPVTACDVVRTYDRPLFRLSPEMVEKRIRESKKPASMVPGDIPPRLVNSVASSVSGPVCDIFNGVPSSCQWPDAWKKEYQTIIPKKPNPSDLSEVRNLSCTNFFSKVLESFVIDSLKTEVTFSELQYGGMKGCGTDNFLCEVWNNVLEELEDSSKAVALMSLDFSKAFNRLSHIACMEKLALKAASNQSIGMVFSFLFDRKMVVRVGEKMSSVRSVLGGSPQGTKLGNILFCLCVDDIVHGEVAATVASERVSSPESAIPIEYMPDDSINPNPYGVRNKINIIRDTFVEDMLTEDEYARAETWEVGYIDDINVGEALDIDSAKVHITTEKTVKTIRAVGCESMFDVVKSNGKKIGLIINPLKTQLLCFSQGASDVVAEANFEGKLHSSTNELKILGFHFSSSPSVAIHIINTVKKYNRSLWSLRHMKKAKLSHLNLVKIYCSMLRPILEYACNVFGPMLNNKLRDMLERCQAVTLKIIFGYNESSEELLRK